MMNLSLTDNPYKTLGIDRTATEAEIKAAYFGLIRNHSPERDPEGFKRIRAAYEKLRAAGERAETDLFLVEDPLATITADSMQHHTIEPKLITPETARADLLALEAIFLLEELDEQKQ